MEEYSLIGIREHEKKKKNRKVSQKKKCYFILLQLFGRNSREYESGKYKIEIGLIIKKRKRKKDTSTLHCKL